MNRPYYKKIILGLVFLLLLINSAVALEIESTGFKNTGLIASEYTCDSDNISPALNWIGVPDGARSFALICYDPDAPDGIWTHWVIFNIPARLKGLPRDFKHAVTSKEGIVVGVNDFGNREYDGPCPPPGNPHRYIFKLYALDTLFILDDTTSRESLLEAMKGHIIAEAQTYGIYKR